MSEAEAIRTAIIIIKEEGWSIIKIQTCNKNIADKVWEKKIKYDVEATTIPDSFSFIKKQVVVKIESVKNYRQMHLWLKLENGPGHCNHPFASMNVVVDILLKKGILCIIV